MNTNKDQVPQCDKTAVKCRFFAQYFGVRVFQNELNKQYNYVNYSHPLTIEKDFNKEIIEFLELKPLSKITDEDKNVLEESIIGFISDIFQVGYFVYIDSETSISDKKMTTPLNIYHLDYLRSKGYALPFMEYSVEDLVSFDWVRLV